MAVQRVPLWAGIIVGLWDLKGAAIPATHRPKHKHNHSCFQISNGPPEFVFLDNDLGLSILLERTLCCESSAG